MTVEQIARAVAGRIDGADPAAQASTVVVDSRRAGPGAVFLALPGEVTDGHRFVDDASKAGAVVSIVREGEAVSGSLVRVADTARALFDLALANRDELTATVIAVTGSSGKTCTKDMIAAGCVALRRVAATEASFNAEIGVPLTVLSADDATEVLVVEVGSRGIGHIADLMPIVRPDVAVVTNVGPAHVGMFGSLENTAKAKGELVETLEQSGTAVLNADDAAVRVMSERTKGRVVLFGRSPDAHVRAEDVTLDADARASFVLVHEGQRFPVSLQIAGEHMVDNALAAAAAAVSAGVPLDAAVEAIARGRVSAWRMDVVDAGDRRILNDAYNANPDSMLAALKALAAMANDRPSWAVLGHMAELGDASVEQHDRIGRMTVRLGIDKLVVVGREAKAILEAARLEGLYDPGDSYFAADPDEAIAILAEHCEHDAVVLVKASRAAGLETIAEALEDMA